MDQNKLDFLAKGKTIKIMIPPIKNTGAKTTINSPDTNLQGKPTKSYLKSILSGNSLCNTNIKSQEEFQ
jgi:hypothetical protein